MKNNVYQKIVSTVRYRILSLEEEVDILDEEILLISHVPGTTEIDQKKLVLLRNVKSVLHDVLLSYYTHFTSICPTTTTSIPEASKYHIQVLKQKEIEILTSELFGQQSALNTFVGQDYYKYSRDFNVPDDMKLRLLAQVFPFEFEFDLLSDSSFFEFLLNIVEEYRVEIHEELIKQLFERISKQKPKSIIYFFTPDSPLYFCLAEHFLSSFVHNQMLHYEWDPLENFSIYQKCRLIATQGPLSCSIKPSLIELLSSAQGNDKILEIIKNMHNKKKRSNTSFYCRPFISRFNIKVFNIYKDKNPNSNIKDPIENKYSNHDNDPIENISNDSTENTNSKNTNSKNETNKNENDNKNDNANDNDTKNENDNENDNDNKNENDNDNKNENDNDNVNDNKNENDNVNDNKNENDNDNKNENDNVNDNKNENDNVNDNKNENDNVNDNKNENDNVNDNKNENDNVNDNKNENDNDNDNKNDSNSNTNNAKSKMSNYVSSEIEEEVFKIRQEKSRVNCELPQLWHVSLDLKRLKLQTSPSFVLCVLANSLRWLTNAITIDGNFVGGEEIIEFFVYSLALSEPKTLPALCSFTDRFIDGGLKDETKFSYLLTQLNGALTFIQQQLLRVPPFLIFPFKKPIERLRGTMNRVESDIIMRGFRIFAIPSFRREREEFFPALLQYTGDEDDVAICSAFSFSAADSTSTIVTKRKVFPLNMPYFEVIPTIYGSFLQLTDELIEQLQMIHIDNGNVDDTIETVNAISFLMKLIPQKVEWRPLKLGDLNGCLESINKKWESRMNKNFAKYQLSQDLENEDDFLEKDKKKMKKRRSKIGGKNQSENVDDNDVAKSGGKFVIERVKIQKLMLLVAEMQKGLAVIKNLPSSFIIDSVLNSWTWETIKEMFHLNDSDFITTNIFDELVPK